MEHLIKKLEKLTGWMTIEWSGEKWIVHYEQYCHGRPTTVAHGKDLSEVLARVVKKLEKNDNNR